MIYVIKKGYNIYWVIYKCVWGVSISCLWGGGETVIHPVHISQQRVLYMYNTMSITDSNVSNMLCKFNTNMSDIINGSASILMKIAKTGSLMNNGNITWS